MSNLNLKITNESKHISKTPEVPGKFSSEEKRKLASAAEDFESMLTGMMIKSMTDTTEGMFGGNGFGGDMFDSMFESQLASFMTKSKSLGLSDQIFRKVTGEELSKFKLEEVDNRMNWKKLGKVSSKGVSELKPSLGSLNRLDKYQDIIKQASQKYGVNENLIKSVILTESAANPKAISTKNAKGLMQLMDSTASDMGVKNALDPADNIQGGVKYLSKMLQQFDGNVELTLAAYNAGPGNVDKYNGIPPFNETKNYINRVLGYLNYLDG